MFPSFVAYLGILSACAIVLARRSFAVDRVLGWIVIGALAVNLAGAGLMGWWVHTVHGREYTAADEMSYQREGGQLLRAWRSGDAIVRTTVGVYAPINAVVIAVAGPGQTQMRMMTAIVSAAGVAASFWLAMLLYRDLNTARLAAFLCATSPLLILYSWANLRDRWISTAAVLVLVATVLVVQRWSWRRAAWLVLSVFVLAALRHYWGALLGWIAIIGYLAFSTLPWARRLGHTAALAFMIGIALETITGTFLAVSMRHETVTRYVAITPSPARDPRGESGSAPEADMRIGTTGAPAEIADSGPTLGEARVATIPTDWRELARNLRFVLFGRVYARADGGQYASKLLFPEALWSFLLMPLAVGGLIAALSAGQRIVLVPAAYIAVMIAILTWLRGDDWNTYRFRGLYWSVLLVLAAGGFSLVSHYFRDRRQPQAGSVIA
jgi:hypothetical protein